MSEKFSSGTKNPNKQTNITFFKERINLHREVHIRGFDLNTVYVLFSMRYIFTLSPQSQKIDISNFILEFIENLKP